MSKLVWNCEHIDQAFAEKPMDDDLLSQVRQKIIDLIDQKPEPPTLSQRRMVRVGRQWVERRVPVVAMDGRGRGLVRNIDNQFDIENLRTVRDMRQLINNYFHIDLADDTYILLCPLCYEAATYSLVRNLLRKQ